MIIFDSGFKQTKSKNMTTINSFFLKPNTRKLLLTLSAIVSFFWILGSRVNIYQVAAVGAIFEILWLPIIILTITIPIISIVFWVKEKFNIKSLYLLSVILILSTLLMLALYK